jgi:diguanylate cyclase (GGDEF)-like protein
MSELPGILEKQLKLCRTLPSIPAVVLEVLDLCQDEDVGIPQVARVLMRDPALSTKLLKVANSPWYGVRSQVATLDRAISLLGINATLSVALSFSFSRNIGGHGGQRLDHQIYWKRAAISAVAARIIGTPFVPRMGRDELFLAGLLQDIGMLALNEALPTAYGPLIQSSNGNHKKLAELEQTELGADHAAVGSWMLEHWNLPNNLRAAVEGSHDPLVLKSDERSVFANAVALASHVAEIWTNPDVNAATALAKEASTSLLQIPSDRFEKMLSEVVEALPEATSDLDIDIGGEESINRLLDQAREALIVLNLHAQVEVREAKQHSQIDKLTGLFNRAYFDENVMQYYESSLKLSQPLSLLFLDLDHFKKVNDSHGHQAGDSVLASVARILRSGTRSPDIMVRYGGEEFIGLLPGTGEKGAELVAERLRAAVEAHNHPISETESVKITISIGCATMLPTDTSISVRDLLGAADRRLYAAKAAGRNCIVAMDSPSE